MTFLLFFVSIYTSLPRNALSMPFVDEIYMQSWFPQGWGFYSKDPTESALYMYDYETFEPSTNWPNNTKENLFGLKRAGRAQGIEAGLIQFKIPGESWVTCEDAPSTCAIENDGLEAVEIENESPYPTICGEHIIVQQEPVPWAWSKYKETTVMPSEIVRVNVTCSAD
ncbi:SdpA family antimicrobial peptide system protein [Paraliobacillus sp. JSM ZJ581]|uniref:SdpA family antimicrobial peptide system protein n=1 Tax=Paraliobacillus sp. JSM ZJ581 TaxID=3342118 RepID=UPI0035A99FA5